MVVVALALAAVASRAEETSARVRLRETLVKDFPFRAPTKPAATQAAPTEADAASADPEVVVLPQLDVHGVHPRIERAEARAIERSVTLAPADTVTLGTGLRERDIGKVRIGTTRILYVPVHLKISW